MGHILLFPCTKFILYSLNPCTFNHRHVWVMMGQDLRATMCSGKGEAPSAAELLRINTVQKQCVWAGRIVCGPVKYLITHLVFWPHAELVMFDNGVQCRWQDFVVSRTLQQNVLIAERPSVWLVFKTENHHNWTWILEVWCHSHSKEIRLYSLKTCHNTKSISISSVCVQRRHSSRIN